MKPVKFNPIGVFVLLTGLLMSGACKKDENATKMICQNLLKQGIADTNLLKGSWNLEYLGKTTNGKNLKSKDTAQKYSVIVNFDSSNVKKMTLGVGNETYFSINYRNSNYVDMNWKGSTYAYSPPIEKKIASALDKTICYVVKGNQLIFF